MTLEAQGYQSEPVGALAYAACRKMKCGVGSKKGRFSREVVQGVTDWWAVKGGQRSYEGNNKYWFRIRAKEAARAHVKQVYGSMAPFLLFLFWNFVLPRVVNWLIDWLWQDKEHRMAVGGQW